MVVQKQCPLVPPFLNFLKDSCYRIHQHRPIQGSLLMVVGLDNAPQLLWSLPSSFRGPFAEPSHLVLPAASSFQTVLMGFPRFSTFDTESLTSLKTKSKELSREYTRLCNQTKYLLDGCCEDPSFLSPSRTNISLCSDLTITSSNLGLDPRILD